MWKRHDPAIVWCNNKSLFNSACASAHRDYVIKQIYNFTNFYFSSFPLFLLCSTICTVCNVKFLQVQINVSITVKHFEENLLKPVLMVLCMYLLYLNKTFEIMCGFFLGHFKGIYSH